MSITTETATPLASAIPVPEIQVTEPKRPDHFEEIQAPYKFDDDEICRMNSELRQALGAKEILADQKKAAMKDFALRIQNKENDVSILLGKLNAGEETRAVKARVEFDTSRSMKRYFHPEEAGAFIREDRMQPADWQLPMFRRDPETKQEIPAVAEPPDKEAVPPATSDPGTTNLGVALDQASSKIKAAQFVLDLTKEDWTAKGLTAAYKKAAGLAGWTPVMISNLTQRLKEAPSVEAMVDTLRPFTVGAAMPEAETPETEAENPEDAEEWTPATDEAEASYPPMTENTDGN